MKVKELRAYLAAHPDISDDDEVLIEHIAEGVFIRCTELSWREETHFVNAAPDVAALLVCFEDVNDTVK